MGISVYRDSKSGYVMLHVRSKNMRVVVSTGLHADKPLLHGQLRDSGAKKHRLREIVNQSEDWLLTHTTATPIQVKNALKEICTGRPQSKVLLTDILKRMADSRDVRNTVITYQHAAKIVEAFDRSATIDDIDADWLKRLEQHELDRGRSVNGVWLTLNKIKAAFNYAIDNELTTNYPFRGYRIRKEATRKRDLTDDQIRVLAAHRDDRYVDIFFLMMYLCGINISDLAEATSDQLRGGRLEYHRNKTGQLISIKVEPEAMEIINRHRGKRHLIDLLEQSPNVQGCIMSMSYHLKKYVPGCSSYYSRHTVASVGVRLGIPVDIIGKLLGHSDSLHSTTLIYVHFDEAQMDAANRKIIDYISRI